MRALASNPADRLTRSIHAERVLHRREKHSSVAHLFGLGGVNASRFFRDRVDEKVGVVVA